MDVMHNMRFHYLILIILASCTSQIDTKAPTLDERYEALEHIILDNSNRIFQFPFTFSNINILAPPPIFDQSVKSYLTDLLDIKDSTYLISQLKGRDILLAQKFKNPSIKVIRIDQLDPEEYWDFLESDSIDGLYFAELPIFNEDKSTIFLRTGYLCGQLCSSGTSYLLKYSADERKWKIDETLYVTVH